MLRLLSIFNSLNYSDLTRDTVWTAESCDSVPSDAAFNVVFLSQVRPEKEEEGLVTIQVFFGSLFLAKICVSERTLGVVGGCRA